MTDLAANFVPYDGPVLADEEGASAAPAGASPLYNGKAAPPGEVFKGWVDDGSGGKAPQFGPPEAAAPPPPDQTIPAAPTYAGLEGAPAAAPTHPPVGFVPYEGPVISEESPKEHSWLDELGIAGRAAFEGAGGLLQSLDGPHVILNQIAKITGLPIGSPEISQIADMVGLPTPQTDNEKLAASTIKGAAAAAPLAFAGGPVIPALLSGAGAGLSGEEARQAGAGPIGQIAASLAGGGLAGGVASGVGNIASHVTGSVEPNAILAAFRRQQVTPMAAQVGGFGSKMMTSGAKATLGGIPLAAAAERSIASAQAARDRIAAGMGTVMDDTGAGQAAQAGVKSFLNTTEQRATHLYNQIPIAGEAPAVLSNTKQALADLNAGLPSNPELSEMLSDGRLQGYENALAGKTEDVPTGVLDRTGKPITRPITKGGKLSWQDLKAFRSYIGGLAGRQTLQSDTSKDALQRLYAGLSEDMRATATNDGPASLKAFTRANSYYFARESRIENTLKAILGNDFQKSPESAFAQIDRWAREGGDAARLARTVRSLPEDEAAVVRASIFARLGRAPPGQQGAADDTFSPASFGTQWAKLDHRAKSVLFPGAEYRQSLDDIAKIAESMKASEKFANTSGTALSDRIGKNLLGSAAVSAIFHALGGGGEGFALAAGGEGLGYGAGMLLGSPRVAKWIASAPKKPIGPATLAHINRLSSIAAAEPAIANEVLHLQEHLARAFTNDNLATRAVANEPGQKSSGVNQGNPQAQQQEQGNSTGPDNSSDGQAVLAQIQRKYPFIGQYNPKVITTPNSKTKDLLETWPAGEEGTPDMPRPASLPINRAGIQIYKPGRVGPEDVAAEFLHVDPTANAARAQILASLSPSQLQYLRHESLDYEDSLNQGETEKKARENAVDSAMRGYIFNQWPAKAVAGMHYTPDQQRALDHLKSYVTGGAG